MERHVSCSGLCLYTAHTLDVWCHTKFDQEKGIYKTKAEIISLEPPKGEVKKNLRKTVKHMLRNSRDEFLGSVESDLNTNPKRFGLH